LGYRSLKVIQTGTILLSICFP